VLRFIIAETSLSRLPASVLAWNCGHCIPGWRQLAVLSGGRSPLAMAPDARSFGKYWANFSRPDSHGFTYDHSRFMNANAYWWCRRCRGTTCRALQRPATRRFMNSHAPDLRSAPFACKKGWLGRLTSRACKLTLAPTHKAFFLLAVLRDHFTKACGRAGIQPYRPSRGTNRQSNRTRNATRHFSFRACNNS